MAIATEVLNRRGTIQELTSGQTNTQQGMSAIEAYARENPIVIIPRAKKWVTFVCDKLHHDKIMVEKLNQNDSADLTKKTGLDHAPATTIFSSAYAR